MKELRAFVGYHGYLAALLSDELYEGFRRGVSGAEPWKGGYPDRGDFLSRMKCLLLSAEPLFRWCVCRRLFELLQVPLGNA